MPTSAWAKTEQRWIVEDYLDMLQLELVGGKFVKSQRNRRLRLKLRNRSRGSVEYKHQNISAVMQLLGHPWIRGYKPLANFQRSLLKAVLEALAQAGGLSALLSADPPSRPPPPNLKIRQGVPDSIHLPPDPEIQRILAGHDPAARDARARQLGEAGERYLLDSERRRLASLGRPDLAGKVRWIAKEEGDGAGFDILSYSPDGAERWLEAKTTNGPDTTPFWITSNELRVSEKHPGKYRVARIYAFKRQPGQFRLKPPLADHVELRPSVYKAMIRGA